MCRVQVCSARPAFGPSRHAPTPARALYGCNFLRVHCSLCSLFQALLSPCLDRSRTRVASTVTGLRRLPFYVQPSPSSP
ncbi:hypothetical protein BE221DRAFT_189169 [Ostreococcus tauri]|uniref:Uncharacterized protein n=1 Tax=Ostreococcus tauri TaxID=70448 RepID=A0A1Y5IL17_OSTTA|nr:hypothetical protein BE221DRAFT_189169 [Ostreococcus tauri]